MVFLRVDIRTLFFEKKGKLTETGLSNDYFLGAGLLAHAAHGLPPVAQA
jgi:hypothetical protein